MRIKTEPATAQAYCQMTDQSGVTIGGWSVKAWEETEASWDYYSKAWHRSHGPKITVVGRFVEFTSESGKQTRKVSLDSWRGNWQLKALLLAKLVTPRKGRMNIRLNEAVEIKRLGFKMGLTFYSRHVKGELLDYAVESPMGMTYHASTPAECVKGLRLKRAEIERKKTAVIDWKFLRSLGFCEEGIKSFCDLFGFDTNDRVTPQEVYDRVKVNPAKATPFLPELERLAKAVDLNLPQSA
jgi:hypothetical protein